MPEQELPITVLYDGDSQRLDRQARFASLPKRAQDAALEKLEHLREAQTGYRSGWAGEAQPGEPRPQYDPDRVNGKTTRFAAKAEELGLKRRTIFRWQEAYDAEQEWGLVNGNAKRDVDPLGNLDPRIIQAVLEQHAVAEVLSSSGGGWPRYAKRLQARLDTKHGVGTVSLPPRTTLQPKLTLLLGGQYTFGTAARRHSRDVTPKRTFRPFHVSRPGEVVMMDATPLDVPAYDPVEDLNIPLELAPAIDVRTRAIIAWRIVPRGLNRADAALLLYDMLQPEPMRPHWREDLACRLLGLDSEMLIDHDARFEHAAARPVIFPELIVVDHGKVNASDAFKGGCRRLGINFQPARKYQSTDKPHIERLFGTIAQEFSAHVAGHKGRNTTERGEFSDRQARWTIAEIEEFFAEWVVSIYQRRPHAGLPVPMHPQLLMSPNQAYSVDVMRSGWIPAPVDPNLFYELLPIEWLHIRRSGVRIAYRTYDHPMLRMYDDGAPSPYLPPVTQKGRLPGRVEGHRMHGNLQPIHTDPRDVLHVYFWAWRPQHQRWVELRWTHAPDPMEPCSETLYNAVRRWMVDHGRDHTDEVDIARTVREFQLRTDAPETWTATTRRQLAAASARARAAARDRAGGELADTEEPRERPTSSPPALDPLDVPPLRPVEDFRPHE